MFYKNFIFDYFNNVLQKLYKDSEHKNSCKFVEDFYYKQIKFEKYKIMFFFNDQNSICNSRSVRGDGGGGRSNLCISINSLLDLRFLITRKITIIIKTITRRLKMQIIIKLMGISVLSSSNVEKTESFTFFVNKIIVSFLIMEVLKIFVSELLFIVWIAMVLGVVDGILVVFGFFEIEKSYFAQ